MRIKEKLKQTPIELPTKVVTEVVNSEITEVLQKHNCRLEVTHTIVIIQNESNEPNEPTNNPKSNK